GIGLMPDGAASLLVPASIGRARANAMVLLGERLAAEDAESAGLVNEVVDADGLEARVDEVAARLAGRSRRALRAANDGRAATTLALLVTALTTEARGRRELLGGLDLAEGMAAVLEHREPRFE